jgi:hypothetical protein
MATKMDADKSLTASAKRMLASLMSRLPFGTTSSIVVPVAPSDSDSKRVDLLRDEYAVLIDQMRWASSFIEMLPLPICLVDKKGFVHHVNGDFSSLVTVPLDGIHCPYAGRFIIHPQAFRAAIDLISASTNGTVISIPIPISWMSSCIVSAKVSTSYVWTLNGNGGSVSVVLAGRYVFK